MKGFDFSACTLLKQFMIKHPEYAVYVLLSLKTNNFISVTLLTSNEGWKNMNKANQKALLAEDHSFACLWSITLVSQMHLRREKYFKTSGGKRVCD
jgi:hypothetical protein